MADKESSLSLVIRAVDKATEPLRRIHEQIAKTTAPIRKLGGSLKEMGELSGVSKLAEGLKGVGEKALEAGKSAFELGEKLLTMEAVGAFALFEVAKAAVESGADLKANAEAVGLTVDEYASLSFAAKQAHVSQDEFTSAMDKFTKNLGLAQANTGPLVSFLERVSPALLQQVKHAHSSAEAFGLMARAFEKVTDPAKRLALGAEVFGKTSKHFTAFLGQGSAAIQEQAKRYLELAGSQEKFADGADEAEKAMNETEAAFMGLRNAAAAELFPALTDVAHVVAEMLASNRDGLKKWATETGAAINAWIKGGDLERLVQRMKHIAHTAGRVMDALGGFKGVAIIVGAILTGPLLMAVVGLGGALLGLVPAIAQVVISVGSLVFAPVIAAIGTFVTALGAGFTAMEAFSLVLLMNPIGLVIAGVAALAGAAYLVYKNWEPIKTFFLSLWDVMKHPIDALKTAGSFWKNVFTGGGSAAADAPADAGRPVLGVSRYMATPGTVMSSTRDARVRVDFANVPKGARVTQDSKGEQPVDLNLGYSMSSAQ